MNIRHRMDANAFARVLAMVLILSKRKLLVHGLAIMVVFPALSLAMDKVTVTVAVSDESGKPVPHAEVFVSFDQPKSRNPWDGTKSKTVSGITNGAGLVTTSDKTLGEVWIRVDSDGYYRSEGSYTLKKDSKGRIVAFDSPISLVIRRREKPVPMYARRFILLGLEIPVVAAPVGYDLLVGDWVAPYGKGTDSDIVFRLEKTYISRNDFESILTVKMARNQDGFMEIKSTDTIVESIFPLPRQAPANSYLERSIVRTSSHRSGQEENETVSPASRNFFFRIRTVNDDEGRVVRALYGKLVGPIECIVHDTRTGRVRMSYYVNPEYNDRNMEFDPKRNLFMNLEWFEKVDKP